MDRYIESLAKEERTVLELSNLLSLFGYKKYRNARFEDYGFYMENREFLAAEGVITFNGADGRLMALKPDMTLSIVKNANLCNGSFGKFYYDENVYRFSPENRGYREIHQVGLELIGEVGDYEMAEALLLAIKSLDIIDSECILAISNIVFFNSVIDEGNFSQKERVDLLAAISEKNVHEAEKICEKAGTDIAISKAIVEMMGISGSLKSGLAKLREIGATVLGCGEKSKVFFDACAEMERLYDMICESGAKSEDGSIKLCDLLELDLCVTSYIDYYSGIIFRGYVRGVPRMVLSGGRYDKLAERIGKKPGAVGFAIYLNDLNLYYPKEKNDADILIAKGGGYDAEVFSEVVRLTSEGTAVRVENANDPNIRSGKVIEWEKR